VLYARWFPRRIDRILLAVIAVVIIAGTVLRADVIGTNNRISSDEVGYAQNANEILADRPLATFKWAPGASLMFAAAAVLRGYSTIAVTTHSHGVAQYSQLLTEAGDARARCADRVDLRRPLGGAPGGGADGDLRAVDRHHAHLPERAAGRLALIAMVAAICWARRRSVHALIFAGLLAGFAGLVREDYAIAVAVIMIGLVVSGWPSRRAAFGRALLYGLVALATVTPFVAYASLRVHRFTPIVDAGPHALFLGTYLPGGATSSSTSASPRRRSASTSARRTRSTATCRRVTRRGCSRWSSPSTRATPTRRRPRRERSTTSTSTCSVSRSSFAHMLWNKAWNMWSFPWSGGNSIGGGGLKRTTSLFQHQLYSVIAWLGVLLGLVLLWRRWAFVVPVLALLAIALLNTFFAITPRDNVRFMPFVFLYGAVGLITAMRWAATRIRERGAPPPPSPEDPRRYAGLPPPRGRRDDDEQPPDTRQRRRLRCAADSRLEAAVEFYGTTLGLERSVYLKDRHFAEFETGNLTLNVMDPQAFGLPYNLNANAIALHVDDIASARARSRGVASSSTARPSTAVSATWRSSPTRTETR